jgi:hypothetical protein
MEEEEFENNIKEAFLRLEKKNLKQHLIVQEKLQFEDNIQKAFLLNERTTLKKRLSSINQNQQPKSNMIWWRLSIAACIIFGISLFFYNSNENSQEGKMAEIKQPSIEKTKKKEIIKQEKTTKDENQIIISKLFAEEIGSLGFASKPFEIKVHVNTANKVLKYRFAQNTITLKSSKKIDVKLYKFQDKFFCKIYQKVYVLEENVDFEIPTEVLDKEILDLLL